MVLNKNCTQASPDELDNAVKFINECMEHVAEKTIPTCQMCSQSKRWWNNDLTKAFKEMRTTRDMVKSYFQHFHQWSEIMLSEVKWLQKKALALVKSAKREYYLKLTEGADTQNMWNFRKWTNGKWVYTSPALTRGNGDAPAVTHSDKCNLLRSTLFPPSHNYLMNHL